MSSKQQDKWTAPNLFPTYTARLESGGEEELPLLERYKNMDDLASHTLANTDEVKSEIVKLIESIPDDELQGALGAQITLVC